MAVARQLLVLLTFLLMSQCVWATNEKPTILKIEGDESFTVQCSSTVEGLMSLDLFWWFEDEEKVLYFYGETKRLTLENKYKNRVEVHGEMTKLSITFSNATANDSGIYSCQYNKVNINTQAIDKFPGKDTLVVVNPAIRVKDNPNSCSSTQHPLPPNLLIVSAISAGSVLLLCITVLLICLAPRVKKFCARRSHRKTPDIIYEDMGRKLHTPC